MNFEQATDELLDMFKNSWDATGYPAFYDNVRDQKDYDKDPWAEVMVRHAFGNQSTLGGIGNREFLRIGALVVVIHVFSGSGLSEGYQLAKVVADTYEGKSSPGGIWFRNVRLNERGRDGSYYRFEVIVEFEYNEIK